MKIVRHTVAHLCELAGFPRKERSNSMLAVDEACTNIIKHTYKGAADQIIIIKTTINDDMIQFILRDFGKKIDLKQIKSRDLDDIRPGGLGVHLIKTIMDEVIYDNTPEVGNQLTLIKYRTKERRRGNKHQND
ncbi:ATP-binding protein [candidate division KSB1 bacterium]|nr:ATP-binding protein [candidate division KSB1 bacterium]